LDIFALGELNRYSLICVQLEKIQVGYWVPAAFWIVLAKLGGMA
jgi:hypothetical protein